VLLLPDTPGSSYFSEFADFCVAAQDIGFVRRTYRRSVRSISQEDGEQRPDFLQALNTVTNRSMFCPEHVMPCHSDPDEGER
jgi:hypothetical protein